MKDPLKGCPYCTGMYATQGETNLETNAPELMDEYNERNRKRPDEIHWAKPKKYGGNAVIVVMNGWPGLMQAYNWSKVVPDAGGMGAEATKE